MESINELIDRWIISLLFSLSIRNDLIYVYEVRGKESKIKNQKLLSLFAVAFP